MFVFCSMTPSFLHAGRERLFLMPTPVPFLSILSPYEYPILPFIAGGFVIMIVL